MKVKGKVAVITGGAGGLGKGFAEALLKNDAKVCLLDLNVKYGLDVAHKFCETYGSGSAMFIRCDVTSDEDMKCAFETIKSLYGYIDIVVNNAGINREDLWAKMIDINVTGVIRGTRLALDYMQINNGGRGGLVINIGSVAGLVPVFPVQNYSASKFAVVGYTRSVGRAVSVKPEFKGIRVSCLCPSYTETELFLERNFATDPLYVSVMDKAVKTMGVMKVDDVVCAFMALVEDDRVHGGVAQVTPEGASYVYPKKLQGSKL